MKKLHIQGYNAYVNIVETDRMDTLPLGTVLLCSSDELRVLADLMDDPQSSVMHIRHAAFNVAAKPKKQRAARK
jgi:hypothetical protein